MLCWVLQELAGLKDVEAKLGSSRSQMEERVQLLQRQLNDANADVESSNKVHFTFDFGWLWKFNE